MLSLFISPTPKALIPCDARSKTTLPSPIEASSVAQISPGTLATEVQKAFIVLSTVTAVCWPSKSVTIGLPQYANGPNIGASTSSICTIGLNSQAYHPVGGGVVTVNVCLAAPPQLSRSSSVIADTPPKSATLTSGKEPQDVELSV